MTDNNSLSRAEADTPGEQVTPAQPYSVRLEFTGSGSEYFRIWIVNLLLTLCTLGLYYPWAKVRRLRYFYGNTLVDGQPLGFHGEAKKMFKGFVLVAVLFACYGVAQNYSQTASYVALLILAGLWPALLKSSLQFRMANTSWRGMRFGFVGSLPGAYKSVLPAWVPAVLLPAVVMLWFPESLAGGAVQSGPQAVQLMGIFGVFFFGTLALIPLLFWNLRKYQHSHYTFSSERAQFLAGPWDFYKLFFKIGLVWLVVSFSFFLFLGLGTAAAFGMLRDTAELSTFISVVVWLGLMAPVAAVYTFGVAASRSMMQNLVWTRTESSHLKFHSDLSVFKLAGLMLKNLALLVLSLGLYWPFAVVASQRMRLQAVGVTFLVPPDDFVASQRVNPGDTAGDAAGDVLGIDIGV
jgi:uncharacterized membrane protein YjgN (DUF898 family)